MGKRFTKPQHDRIYNLLVEKDGEQCRECGSGEYLQIDHIDNNKQNNVPENWQLLCRSCNSKKGNAFRWGIPMSKPTTGAATATQPIGQPKPKANHAYESPPGLSSDQREREREFKPGRSFVSFNEDLKKYLGFDEGSSELRANNYYESKYRSFVIRHVENTGYITKDDAHNGAAERIGCSPLTAKRYFDKMISSIGPLAVNESRFGYPVWELKAQALATMNRTEAQAQTQANKKVIPIRK